VNGVSRPGQTSPSARRINAAGDYEISWTPAANAAAYVVLFEVPGGADELGNPYISLTGVRVPVCLPVALFSVTHPRDIWIVFQLTFSSLFLLTGLYYPRHPSGYYRSAMGGADPSLGSKRSKCTGCLELGQ
jgi:hypothetical protein